MSSKFIAHFTVTFIVLLLAWAFVTFVYHGTLGNCFKNIWGPVLLIMAAMGIVLIIANGWDTASLKDSVLSVISGVLASILVALVYEGFTHYLLK